MEKVRGKKSENECTIKFGKRRVTVKLFPSGNYGIQFRNADNVTFDKPSCTSEILRNKVVQTTLILSPEALAYLFQAVATLNKK